MFWMFLHPLRLVLHTHLSRHLPRGSLLLMAAQSHQRNTRPPRHMAIQENTDILPRHLGETIDVARAEYILTYQKVDHSLILRYNHLRQELHMPQRPFSQRALACHLTGRQSMI